MLRKFWWLIPISSSLCRRLTTSSLRKGFSKVSNQCSGEWTSCSCPQWCWRDSCGRSCISWSFHHWAATRHRWRAAWQIQVELLSERPGGSSALLGWAGVGGGSHISPGVRHQCRWMAILQFQLLGEWPGGGRALQWSKAHSGSRSFVSASFHQVCAIRQSGRAERLWFFAQLLSARPGGGSTLRCREDSAVVFEVVEAWFADEWCPHHPAVCRSGGSLIEFLDLHWWPRTSNVGACLVWGSWLGWADRGGKTCETARCHCRFACGEGVFHCVQENVGLAGFWELELETCLCFGWLFCQ